MAGPKRTVMFAFGTRPEAVKMAPLVKALQHHPDFQPRVAVTGQHREMLDQVLDLFDITPDHDLALMQPGQSLEALTGRALSGIADVLRDDRPDALVVQGDTTSTFAAALAAFYARVPVVHVEAGLRTGDKFSPFPEEINRMLTTRLTDLHLAPTEESAANLTAEGIDRSAIAVTGNTVIDALLSTTGADLGWTDPSYKDLFPADRRTILVTAHRRESWGDPMRSASEGLRDVLDAFPDVEIVFPLHRNPIVRDVVVPVLGDHDRVRLLEPASYPDFCQMMARSHLVVTDSGGVQEEAPSLGKPVLVMRDTTERPEAVVAGTAALVGTDRKDIVTQVSALLADEAHYRQFANAVNPYGDGRAAERSVAALEEFFGTGRRLPDFTWTRPATGEQPA